MRELKSSIFPKMGFPFLDENFPTRTKFSKKFPTAQNFGGGGTAPPPAPVTTPRTADLRWATCRCYPSTRLYFITAAATTSLQRAARLDGALDTPSRDAAAADTTTTTTTTTGIVRQTTTTDGRTDGRRRLVAAKLCVCVCVCVALAQFYRRDSIDTGAVARPVPPSPSSSSSPGISDAGCPAAVSPSRISCCCCCRLLLVTRTSVTFHCKIPFVRPPRAR